MFNEQNFKRIFPKQQNAEVTEFFHAALQLYDAWYANLTYSGHWYLFNAYSKKVCTPCLRKKVAHHTLRNIFTQGWPIAKISTATESEIISNYKCVINVLIVSVSKCCHLAN